MSLSQPTGSSAGQNAELYALIAQHRKDSEKKAKLQRALRFAGVNVDKNKKPTDYKASDFFPPLPPEYEAQMSQEVTLENKKTKALKEIGNSTQTKTARKSLNSKLNPTNNEKTTPIIEQAPVTAAAAAPPTPALVTMDETQQNKSVSKTSKSSSSSNSMSSDGSNFQASLSSKQNKSIVLESTIHDKINNQDNSCNDNVDDVHAINENKENTHVNKRHSTTSRGDASYRRKSTVNEIAAPTPLAHPPPSSLVDEETPITTNDSLNNKKRRSLATSFAAQSQQQYMDQSSVADDQKEKTRRVETLNDPSNEMLIGSQGTQPGAGSQGKTSSVSPVKTRKSIIETHQVSDESGDSDDDDEEENTAVQKLIIQQQRRNSLKEKSNTSSSTSLKITSTTTTSANKQTDEVIVVQQSSVKASTSNKETRTQKYLSSTLKMADTSIKSPKGNTSNAGLESGSSKTPLRQAFNTSLKRRSHNLSRVDEREDSGEEQEEEEEEFNLKEGEEIVIHGMAVDLEVNAPLLTLNETKTNNKKSKTQLIPETKETQQEVDKIATKSKSPTSRNKTRLEKSNTEASFLPPPPPPPPAEVAPPPPPPHRKCISKLEVTKKSALNKQTAPSTDLTPDTDSSVQSHRRISSPQPPPPPPPLASSFKATPTSAMTMSQPSTSTLPSSKLVKSTSSSSISSSSSQPSSKKGMTSRASLRNLEEAANDSKDEAEMNALNGQLIRRSFTNRSSFNNRTDNSTLSNGDAVDKMSASQIFKSKFSNQVPAKPMPPLFPNINSESNRSSKATNEEVKTTTTTSKKSAKQDATSKSIASTSNASNAVDPYEFHNEVGFDYENENNSARESRSRTRRSKEINKTNASNNSNNKASTTTTTGSAVVSNEQSSAKSSGLKDMTNRSDKRSKRVNDTSSSTKSSSPEKAPTKTLRKSKTNKKQRTPSPEKENSKANQPNTVSAPKKTSTKQKTQKRKIITPAPDADTDEQTPAAAIAVEATNDEECPNGLRRSKRAKIGHGCHAKYNWDEIVDYGGNKVRVLSKVGTLDQRNLFAESARKYLLSLEAKKAEREKARKKSSSKSPRKRVSKKSSKKAQEEEEEDLVVAEEEQEEEVEKEVEEAPKKLSKEERKQLKYEAKVRMRKEEKRRLRKLEKERKIEEEEGYTEGGDGQDYIMNVDQQQQHQDESISGSTSQASLEQFTQFGESQINGTQETILVQNPKTNTNKNHRMYLFANAERKYEELMPGVGVVILSKEQGIYRLDPLCYNSTSLHDVPISYVVQNGSILCSINGILSRHTAGDIINIPKESRYKFKNTSSDSKAFLHFKFSNK